MYTRIRTPVNRMITALNAVSTVPRAMAATGNDTRCSVFLRVKKFFTAVMPSAEASNAPAGCFSHPAGVYAIVA